MSFIPLGRGGTPLSSPGFIRADSIQGGTITAQELILAGGTHGVVRSQNYDGSDGWAFFGDGSGYIGGDVTIGGTLTVTGDVYSANWNGTIPANLASKDGGASAGYYLDTSVGASQWMGDMWIDGTLTVAGDINASGNISLTGSGLIQTASSGERLVLGAGSQEYVEFYDGATLKFQVGFRGVSDDVGIFSVDANQLYLSSENGIFHHVSSGDSHVFEVDTYYMLTITEDYLRLDTGLNGTQASPALQVGGSGSGFYSPSGNGLAMHGDGEGVFLDDYMVLGGSAMPSDGRSWSPANVLIGSSPSLAIGSHGSYRGSIDWNFYRGASAYYHAGQNGYDEWASIYMDNSGIRFAYERGTFTGTVPSLRAEINDSGLYMYMDGSASTPAIRINDANSGLYMTGSNTLVMTSDGVSVIGAAGTDGSMYINQFLDSIGNHETLRAARVASNALTEVGYYSSWVVDPDTGRRMKKGLVPLERDTPSANGWWTRDWFMDIQPIKYERIRSKKSKAIRDDPDLTNQPEYPQIELGFSIENLSKNTNLLTTKGAALGNAPDEFALLAVTIDYVQHLEQRLAAAEKQLALLA